MTSHYLIGNELYSAGDIKSAIASYSRALDGCNDTELQVKIWLNRAQCYLKNEQYSEAFKNCCLVINVLRDGTNSLLYQKALIRRAQANEALGNYEKALLDVEALLSNSPVATLAKTGLIMRSRLRNFVELDSDVARQEGRPTMMVTNQQALRLAFIEQPPEFFRLGETYLIRLCITNELGLWDRQFAQKNMILAEKCVDKQQPVWIANIQCALQEFNIAEGGLNGKESEQSAESVQELFQLEMLPCDNASSNPWGVEVDGKVNVMVRIISKSGYTTTLSSFVVVMLHFTLDRALPQCGEIVPVLSLPARVVNTAICLNTPEAGPDTACVDRQEVNVVYARVLQLCRTVHATCVRQLPISLPGGSAPAVTAEVEEREKERESFCAYALESPGYLGIAGKVWDSMYVLLQYLSLHSEELVSGKRIIELGCGTGLAGISLCPLDPQCVALTDMPEVVPLISANILLNSVVMGDPHAQSILRDRYEALPYTWGTALGSDSQSAVAVKKAPGRYFDTILASDVVYYPEGYQPLLSTLRDLLGAPSPSSDANSTNTAARGEGGDGGGGARSGGPVCILAHRHRHPEDKKFFDALYATETLAVERLDFHVQQQVQVRGDTTQQGKDVQALKDVILFRITMR